MLDVAGAGVAALLAFTAVPVVLVMTVGNPLAGGLGHGWHPLQRDTLCLLVLAAWVAWVACCAQLLRAVIARVRDGDVRVRRGSSVIDRVAARIAFGVLAVMSAGTPLALSVDAGACTPAGGAATSAMASAAAPAPPADHSASSSGSPRTDRAPGYTVQPGDTLWDIADRHLADGADWSAIAALNLGRDVGGGARFVDPDLIRTGWRLRLPGPVPCEAARGGQADDAVAASGAPSGHLPELIALGLGSLACAALARRAGQRHRRGARFAGDPLDRHAVSEGAQDAATLLYRFTRVPALHSFEAANCLLAVTLDDRSCTPAVRAICVSDAGVTFCLAGPQTEEPPRPFVRGRGGTAWHVSHGALDGVSSTFPHLPLVVPVGDNEEGTWLLPLGPGTVLPFLGESAPALWRSARAAVTAWAWSETLVVTEDPQDAKLVAELSADSRVARHILFCGAPSALSPPVAARCAVITMEPVSATDLTVLVDRQAATLHPMGEVVRPHLQTSETAAHIDELMTPVAPAADDVAGCTPPDVARRPAAAAALVPGSVDVRLLTMTPRLDGLQEDLPPNRARRAVELVAYLALHRPDAITSDRLRTRVLGSSDADAASKTLFNTAYAARRAMGVDEHGDPLLPAGSRHGQYQISPDVTTDVQRATALAGEAQRTSDPAAAIACYRAALSLVEGEPLANALSGYSWWEGEGHGARVAAVLVNAACTMASLASEKGHFDLARWGLEQARLVEPYSEALSRAAMEVAAAEGDADRLRAEWSECQRRVDALDPGCSPSARTESLYAELSRRMLVHPRPRSATMHDIGDRHYDEAPLSSS